jgi:DNA-directed RNA polymerase specialized sigma24 family protein
MIDYTRLRLTLWARYVKGNAWPRGYPSASAFVHANEGERIPHNAPLPPMPPDIEETDQVVCRAPEHHRTVLYVFYLQDCSFRERARRVRMSTYRFKKALARAVEFVDRRLDVSYQSGVVSRQAGTSLASPRP